MKVIECCKCHKLFKSTEDHFVFYSREKNMNYCRECSVELLRVMVAGLTVMDDYKGIVDDLLSEGEIRSEAQEKRDRRMVYARV